MENSHKDNGVPPDGGRKGSCEVNRPATGGLRGAELRRALANMVDHLEKLDRAMTSLPHVDEQGSSECPFAEDLYAQKEEAEKQVLEDVNRLMGYMRAIEHAIAQCRSNVARIRADSAKLNGEKARDSFSSAEEAAERELREAIQDRDAISVVLARAQAVLKVSQTRKFPGREPQRRPPVPVVVPGASEGPGPRLPAGGIGRELGGLLSIGPLGQTPSK